MNVNTASVAQLEGLPGIGPSMAQRIVAYREKNGPFKKLEELLESAVIGRFIGVRASYQLSGDLLRSPEVSGKRSA